MQATNWGIGIIKINKKDRRKMLRDIYKVVKKYNVGEDKFICSFKLVEVTEKYFGCDDKPLKNNYVESYFT